MNNNDIDMVLSRRYQDGDIVEFNFEPHSLDIRDFGIVTLTGVVTGLLLEGDERIYMVQMRDNDRYIFGQLTIPEKHINGKID